MNGLSALVNPIKPPQWIKPRNVFSTANQPEATRRGSTHGSWNRGAVQKTLLAQMQSVNEPTSVLEIWGKVRAAGCKSSLQSVRDGLARMVQEGNAEKTPRNKKEWLYFVRAK